ncbi:MAG: acyl-CoA dehydratase activase-related protein [Syntrophales bacterium]
MEKFLMDSVYHAGVDIGSTTIKVAVYDERAVLAYSAYRRHNAMATEALGLLLADIRAKLGEITIKPNFTGSAGIGISEQLDLPFVQEVAASAVFLQKMLPDVRTFIEIGGEDAKIIFFDEQLRPQVRMNGSCAGGTGAFIEQMALFLDVSLEDFGTLARIGRPRHPIASRCGVFAKTDVQSLLSNSVAREDIAASIFHALALQVLASLGCGNEIRGKVLFAGGPLAFLPALVEAFIKILNLDRERDVVSFPQPELIAAMGTAFCCRDSQPVLGIEALQALIGKSWRSALGQEAPSLRPLFQDEEERQAWEARHRRHVAPRRDLADLGDEPCFLGIDSGSTTTKMVLIDARQRVLLDYYSANGGDSLSAARKGMAKFNDLCHRAGKAPFIARTAVTGYGEDLIKAAFGIDDGIVETMAHFRAARTFVPEVSFLLDIGGQDMKALFIREGTVADVQINEACSSGCGSFLETFAGALAYDPAAFAQLACGSTRPFDLGTRCTVFMNSRVRQALREGATVADIAAGLAYAVVKNSLYKVLKLRDHAVLGEHIVVQGGTFCNPAVLRAFELLLGREVVRLDMAAMMGAYGAALTARQHYERGETLSSFQGWEATEAKGSVKTSSFSCRGCENDCQINSLLFATGQSCVFGNRCDRHFTNGGAVKPGVNMVARKLALLFDRSLMPAEPPLLTFGIPRVLNMYDSFPFWCTFLVACGFKVMLSGKSEVRLFEKGVGTIMSDNVCFPAKLVHGHVADLVARGVDRIFYPTVVFEQREYSQALSSYNCPVVTGYPDVIRSAVDPAAGKRSVPMDSPVIGFQAVDLLQKQLYAFVKPFGVGRKKSLRAVEQALEAQATYKTRLQEETNAVITAAEKSGESVLILAGRPYHADPLVNHGIPQLVARLGLHVITEDGLPVNSDENFLDSRILTQWAFTNRMLAAARFVAAGKVSGMMQLTSFGCGLDALAADEAKEIVTNAGRIYALIKIDEIANLGAANIRIRALIESLQEKAAAPLRPTAGTPLNTSFYSGRAKTILIPWFSPFYSPFIPDVFRHFGYNMEMLPPQDKESVEIGLRYVNNDMCYPAVIIIGDVIKAMQSGKYDPDATSVMFTQTFGQCRASNYVPLMGKALKAAGFGEVTVFSLAADSSGLQFPLEIDSRELAKRLSLGLIFVDALSSMVLATLPHEIKPGSTAVLQSQVMAAIADRLDKGEFPPLLKALRDAVAAFNEVEVDDRPLPVIGLVGEIFVKHNSFSNQDMVAWLMAQGVEVVLPSLVNFFTQRFVNEEFNQSVYLDRSFKKRVMSRLLGGYIQHYLRQVESVRRHFRYYRKNGNLRELAVAAGQVTNLANQAGEGWLLPAEMIAMTQNGVEDIICLQPFGCLANHVTGKGVEKRMKALYPRLNLHFLDMDAGTSEVNTINRLHLILEMIKGEHKTARLVKVA